MQGCMNKILIYLSLQKFPAAIHSCNHAVMQRCYDFNGGFIKCLSQYKNLLVLNDYLIGFKITAAPPPGANFNFRISLFFIVEVLISYFIGFFSQSASGAS